MINDTHAIAELGEVSDVSELHTILHYLYVSSSDDADAIASELQRNGYHTEQRLGADGVNWLVLARHEMIPTQESMASLRKFMEKLLSPCNGEYDGWEAKVRRP